MQLSLLLHSLAPAAASFGKSQKSTPDLSFNHIIRSYSILHKFRPRTLGFEQDVVWIKVVHHTLAKKSVVITRLFSEISQSALNFQSPQETSDSMNCSIHVVTRGEFFWFVAHPVFATDKKHRDGTEVCHGRCVMSGT